MQTIEDIQGAFAQAVEALVPPEHAAVVALLDSSGRKKRRDAAGRNWDPMSGSVSITFVKTERPSLAPKLPAETDPVELPSPALSRQLLEAIQALDTAERTRSFVALKWFRDHYLPGAGVHWAAVPYAGQEVIKQAIDCGLFLTGQVPNPKTPAFRTTTICLNRQRPDVQRVLGAAPAAPSRVFRPVPISGEPLSATVIRERR
jgi:hypothetical protein